MKHTLQISVSKKPMNSGAVSVRRVSVRERLMRFLFGDTVRLTVIVPGNSWHINLSIYLGESKICCKRMRGHCSGEFSGGALNQGGCGRRKYSMEK